MSGIQRQPLDGVLLCGRMVARPGMRQALVDLLIDVAQIAGEREPGCLGVSVHLDVASEDVVVLYEHYADEAAFAEHRANYERYEDYGRMRTRLGELLAEPPQITRLTGIARFVRA